MEPSTWAAENLSTKVEGRDRGGEEEGEERRERKMEKKGREQREEGEASRAK